MTRLLVSGFGTVLVCLLAVVPAQAATWNVLPDGSGDFVTIQDAVNGAGPGDIILLGSGTFTGPGNFAVSIVAKTVTLRSATGDPDDCIIDCGSAGRGFYIAAGHAGTRIEGITVTNGYAAWGTGYDHLGGAILLINNNDGPVFTDCAFVGNHAESNGGAVWGGGDGAPSFTDCRFEDNSAEGLGGAFNSGFSGSEVCEPTFDGCVFLRNSSDASGGAVYGGKSDAGEATIVDCLFAGNTAPTGGAVYSKFYDLVVNRCTFSGNDAPTGGNLYVSAGWAVIKHSIFAFAVGGEGIACGTGTASLACCDVYGNEGGDYVGCLVGKLGVNDNFSADPLFCDSETWQFTVATTSPCVSPQSAVCGQVGAYAADCTPSAFVGRDWYGFDPETIPHDYVGTIAYRVRLTGVPATTPQINLTGGGSVVLAPDGDRTWAGTLTAAQALYGYDASDEHHNFVGLLNYDDGAGTNNYSCFIHVSDDRILSVATETGPADMKMTHNVVNYHWPAMTYPPTGDARTAITHRFYADFSDDYDFLNLVFTLPSYQSNRYYRSVRNDVEGIGSPIFDSSGIYGSAGRLLGIVEYPINTYYDLAIPTAIHEIGHQWINDCLHPLLLPGPHWPTSSLARGIMGRNNSPTNPQGVAFPYDLSPLPNGDYEMLQSSSSYEFTDLDLYLMGLLPSGSVADHIVFTDPNQPICDGCSGPVDTITVSQVMAMNGGPRDPDASISQKDFRSATIVITRDRLLSDEEMALYHHLTRRGEATTTLTFHSGHATGTAKPFYVATQGLGTLTTQLGEVTAVPPEPVVRPALRLAQNTPNPFLPATRISFELPAAGRATLAIYRIDGGLVKVVLDEHLPAGPHEVTWNGRDHRGRRMPSGVYFYRLVFGDRQATRRMVLIN